MQNQRVFKGAWSGKCAFALLLACVLLVMGVCSAGIADERKASISAVLRHDGQNVEGVVFRLYRVASQDEDQSLVLTGAFAGYPVKIEGLDSAGWAALANTLSGYVQSDQIPPLQSASTDSQGRVSFGGLEPGVYLVDGERSAQGDKLLVPQPVLVVLPVTGEGGAPQYDVELNIKSETTDRELTDLTVLKIWKDQDYEGRPLQIEVQLVGGGEVYDTVILSKENNWQYSWTELDPEIEWHVVELQPPEGYEVQVERSGHVITIVNSYEPEDDEPDDPTLPQTGLLWWPVPVLAIAGMLLFVIGWFCWRHDAK